MDKKRLSRSLPMVIGCLLAVNAFSKTCLAQTGPYSSDSTASNSPTLDTGDVPPLESENPLAAIPSPAPTTDTPMANGIGTPPGGDEATIVTVSIAAAPQQLNLFPDAKPYTVDDFIQCKKSADSLEKPALFRLEDSALLSMAATQGNYAEYYCSAFTECVYDFNSRFPRKNDPTRKAICDKCITSECLSPTTYRPALQNDNMFMATWTMDCLAVATVGCADKY
jgi:hypothetical protein